MGDTVWSRWASMAVIVAACGAMVYQEHFGPASAGGQARHAHRHAKHGTKSNLPRLGSFSPFIIVALLGLLGGFIFHLRFYWALGLLGLFVCFLVYRMTSGRYRSTRHAKYKQTQKFRGFFGMFNPNSSGSRGRRKDQSRDDRYRQGLSRGYRNH